jgi:hypothetical protein
MEKGTMQQSANKSDEVYQVEFAARLLGTNEFKLFENAYQAWHGKKPSEKLLEHFFNRYLLENVVPFWVRNYVRTFINDPVLHERLGRKRRVAACCYVVPIVLEYTVIMYFLL